MLPKPQSPENQQPIENDASSPLESVRLAFPLNCWAGHPLVLGISGGPDSVALLRLLLELRGETDRRPDLILAHCNYRLRGGESDADEEFVRELASRLQLDCHVWRAEKLEKTGGSGWEAHLRDLRYAYFKQVCQDTGARYLALAHTADDQVETVLLRLLRGSSIVGLRGIPAQRSLTGETTIIRPVLNVHRQTLRDYLAKINQPFRIDSSNDTNRFQRNRIRNQLLPLLAADYGSDLPERMRGLALEAAELQNLLDELCLEFMNQFEFLAPNRLRVQPGRLAAAPQLLVRHALVKAWRTLGWSERDLTSRHWHALGQLLQLPMPETGVVNLPENRIARRYADGSMVIE